ncbi:MAG TPA: ABC transporter permease [Cyclobacteriaceae bacterium]|jgi:putative ABC transport system permease protein|nr:ABC transporter permease [Cyclobacteriaceae bacterium]
MLTGNQIDFIVKDLNFKGIVAEEIQDEVIDHVCSAVETEMENGKNFIEAYRLILKSFGHTPGLLETQEKVIKSETTKPKGMIKNYLTVAFRNLQKHRFYSFINIAGLAVGIASCLMIVLFIIDELSFDAYNLKADRIYRLNEEIKFGDNHVFVCQNGAPLASSMLNDYPEIEATVRFRNVGSYLVRAAGATTNVKEMNVIWTDSTFFRVFSVNVLAGNPRTALKEASSAAISRRMAEKYFPGKSALGESMILDNKLNVKVTAVYENIPAASHFHFDILIAMVGSSDVAKEAQSVTFLSENFNTYLLLKEGADAKALEKKFPAFLKKYFGPQVAAALGNDMNMEKFTATGNKWELTMTPLRDIHLKSDLSGELETNGNITYVYLFGAIAIFILGIACINFMNLSTARSSNRAKEVGVRKVMGSLRSHLMRQFLTESILVTLFSFLLAIGVAYMLLPLFNDLAQKQLQIPFGNWTFYGALLIAVLLVGLLAGVYPSFFLSAFKPVSVLKGNVARGMKSGYIRSALVVFQFVISITLIIGAITVNRQLNFIQNKKLGFNKSQVIIIHDTYALRPLPNAIAFKNEVSKISAVSKGSLTSYLPVEGYNNNNNTFWKQGNQPTPDNLVSIRLWTVDENYVETMGMKIKLGRDFSEKFPSDSTAVILNEAALPMFGITDDPLGKKITSFDGVRPDGSPDPNKLKTWEVVGVVENFHYYTMKEGILPLGLFFGKDDGCISFRFNSSQANDVVQSIEKIWKQLAPGQPFQYSFLDEDFGRMYRTEQRLSNIFLIFAGLAIIIACLGLFALTAFTAEQRTKEIGIRKVLGASVSSIVLMLSKDFGKLVIIAFVISAPIAWYGADWWLKGYTYKTTIEAWVFLCAGLAAVTIAWVTMSFQSFKAASNDPVKSLKSE